MHHKNENAAAGRTARGARVPQLRERDSTSHSPQPRRLQAKRLAAIYRLPPNTAAVIAELAFGIEAAG